MERAIELFVVPKSMPIATVVILMDSRGQLLRQQPALPSRPRLMRKTEIMPLTGSRFGSRSLAQDGLRPAGINLFVVSGSPGQIWQRTSWLVDREDFALRERWHELQLSGYRKAPDRPA